MALVLHWSRLVDPWASVWDVQQAGHGQVQPAVPVQAQAPVDCGAWMSVDESWAARWPGHVWVSDDLHRVQVQTCSSGSSGN